MKLEDIIPILRQDPNRRFRFLNDDKPVTEYRSLANMIDVCGSAYVLEDRLVELEPLSEHKGILEQIVTHIQAHDIVHFDHGEGCACHDLYAERLRFFLQEQGFLTGDKSDRNLRHILSMVLR